MDKREAVGLIVSAAKRYKEMLCGKQFLLACGDSEFREVAFQAHNFAHFTGVRLLNCTAKQFYERALSGKLSAAHFTFSCDGNTQRKLAVIGQLPGLFHAPLLYGAFLDSGIFISADYFVGKNFISVGFRTGKSIDVPVTLYNEDIRKLTYQPEKILAVWEKPIGGECYEELTYSRIEAPEKLLDCLYHG